VQIIWVHYGPPVAMLLLSLPLRGRLTSFINPPNTLDAMQGQISRRNVLSALGGSIATGSILYLSTDTSQASGIDVKGYSINNKDATVRNPVTGVSVTVDGSYGFDSTKLPTRVVLRFEAKEPTANEWTQLAANGVQDGLEKEMQRDFSLSGNVLDVSGFTAPGLTPSAVGETITREIDTRLTLEVLDVSKTLKEYSVEDTAKVEITMGSAKVETNITAGGFFNVTT